MKEYNEIREIFRSSLGEDLSNKLDNTEEYAAAQEQLTVLEKQYAGEFWLKIDDQVCDMELLSEERGFVMGFRMAARLYADMFG